MECAASQAKTSVGSTEELAMADRKWHADEGIVHSLTTSRAVPMLAFSRDVSVAFE